MVVGTEMVGATRQLFVPMNITIKYYVNVVIFATVCFCYLSDMYGCGYRNGLCHKVAVCPHDNHSKIPCKCGHLCHCMSLLFVRYVWLWVPIWWVPQGSCMSP